MGFLKNLLLPEVAQPQPSMPVVTTGLHQTIISLILSGSKPILRVRRIALKKGEECRFCDHAVRVDEKLKVVGHQRTRNGFSIRIIKGVYYRTGAGNTMAVRDNVQEYQQGKLYITNKRIIFSASSKSFSKNLSDLVSYNVQDNYLILQFEKGNYCIYLPVVQCADQVMQDLM